ncbi:MFS family transporter: glycerol-3-phosphate [Achlya hypogyna]|uniref:MFS family transporter: glycerol-3-phosphate n=1 Tax=Achlya hypogyna TaxID=1202772 RepID=A0A1V9Z2C3_ACHHY|nr:MFS family transporter: glycerol-3-phosphate [Achlya hypogyna]
MGPRSVFALTYAAYIAVYFTRKPLSVTKATLTAEHAHSEAQLGLIDTAFLVSYAAGQFASGVVASMVGTRHGLALAFVGTGLCSYVFGSSASPDVRAAVWAANGLFQALFFPLIVDVLRAWFPPSTRGQVMGIWTTCQQVGGFATSAFGAYVLSTPGLTWRDAFTGPSFLAFTFALVVLVLLPTAPDSLPKIASSDGPLPASPPSMPFAAVLRVPHLPLLSAAYFCIKLVRYTYLGWLPFYLTNELGYAAAESVLMSTAFDVAGTVGSVVCGFASDKLCAGRSAKVVAPMCLLCGLCTLIYPHVAPTSQAANLVAMALIGLFVAGPDSMLGGAACAEVCDRANAPTASAMATGITNGMGSLGAIASGMLPILIKEQFGWTILFYTMGGLAVLGSFMLLPMLQAPKQKTA